jgi:hypothetical protein
MHPEKKMVGQSMKNLSTISTDYICCNNKFFIMLQRIKKIKKEVKNGR